jgi:hypothetical protein
VNGGIAQLFLNLGTRRGCVVSITPRPPLLPGKNRYPLYRRLGGPGVGLDRCGKSHPTRIRSPDLPVVASRYTDYAVPVLTTAVGLGNYYNRYMSTTVAAILAPSDEN